MNSTTIPIRSLASTRLMGGALALSLPFLLAGRLPAGTINLNLTGNTPTSTGADGNGILGGGTWNRLNVAQRLLQNALVKNSGAATPVRVTQSAGMEPATATEPNGNLVQRES